MALLVVNGSYFYHGWLIALKRLPTRMNQLRAACKADILRLSGSVDVSCLRENVQAW